MCSTYKTLTCQDTFFKSSLYKNIQWGLGSTMS